MYVYSEWMPSLVNKWWNLIHFLINLKVIPTNHSVNIILGQRWIIRLLPPRSSFFVTHPRRKRSVAINAPFAAHHHHLFFIPSLLCIALSDLSLNSQKSKAPSRGHWLKSSSVIKRFLGVCGLLVVCLTVEWRCGCCWCTGIIVDVRNWILYTLLHCPSIHLLNEPDLQGGKRGEGQLNVEQYFREISSQ